MERDPLTWMMKISEIGLVDCVNQLLSRGQLKRNKIVEGFMEYLGGCMRFG